MRKGDIVYWTGKLDREFGPMRQQGVTVETPGMIKAVHSRQPAGLVYWVRFDGQEEDMLMLGSELTAIKPKEGT